MEELSHETQGTTCVTRWSQGHE